MAMTKKEKILRVGIVGAGLIGGKRADAISRIPGNKVVAFADEKHQHAEALAKKYGAQACHTWKELIARKDIDVIVVGVPSVFSEKIVIAALNEKKHVL